MWNGSVTNNSGGAGINEDFGLDIGMQVGRKKGGEIVIELFEAGVFFVVREKTFNLGGVTLSDIGKNCLPEESVEVRFLRMEGRGSLFSLSRRRSMS